MLYVDARNFAEARLQTILPLCLAFFPVEVENPLVWSFALVPRWSSDMNDNNTAEQEQLRQQFIKECRGQMFSYTLTSPKPPARAQRAGVAVAKPSPAPATVVAAQLKPAANPSNSRDEVAQPASKPSNQLRTVVQAKLPFRVPMFQDKKGDAAKFRKGSKGRVFATPVNHAAEDIDLDNRKLQKKRQMVTRIPDRAMNFMVVALMHNDERHIAFIRNVLKIHELLTVRMYSVAEGGALGSKSQRVTLPYGVPKQGGTEEKRVLKEPVEALGANAVWLNGQADVQVPWERIFSWPLPFEGRGNLERRESIGFRLLVLKLANGNPKVEPCKLVALVTHPYTLIVQILQLCKFKHKCPRGGRLQPVLMRHTPSYLSKLGGGGLSWGGSSRGSGGVKPGVGGGLAGVRGGVWPGVRGGVWPGVGGRRMG